MASNLVPQLAKKKVVVRPQVQETMTKPDKMFGVEKNEWCETAESIVPPIIKELKKKKWLSIYESDSMSDNRNG